MSLGTFLCLALRVACSHAKRLSCRFVTSLTLRAASQAPLSNWHAPVVEPPIGDSHPPTSGEYTNKNAQLLTGHFYINDGGEGGIDSLRSPCGQRRRLRCPTGMRQLSNPQSGILIPPRSGEYTNKNAQLLTGHFYINDGGEGGLIRFAHPAGSVAGSAVQLACASCRTPHRGFSSPHAWRI